MNLFAAMAVLAAAQDAKTEDKYRWVERAIKDGATRLEIADDQVAKIIEKVKKALAELDKIRDEAKKDAKEILGDEKYGRFSRQLDRLLGGQGGQSGQGRQGRAGGFGNLLDRFKQDLALTEAQIEKVKPLVDEYSTKIRELFQNARDSGAQGFREVAGKMREELQKLADKVKEQLTDDQKPKLDELLKSLQNRFGGRRGQNQN